MENLKYYYEIIINLKVTFVLSVIYYICYKYIQWIYDLLWDSFLKKDWKRVINRGFRGVPEQKCICVYKMRVLPFLNDVHT